MAVASALVIGGAMVVPIAAQAAIPTTVPPSFKLTVFPTAQVISNDNAANADFSDPNIKTTTFCKTNFKGRLRMPNESSTNCTNPMLIVPINHEL